MNKKALESFMQQLQQDAAMQQAIKAEFGAEAAAGVPLQKVMELAERQGYTLPAAGLDEELDEAELDAVSGGAYDAFLKIEGVDGESTSLHYDPTRSFGSRLDFGSSLFLKIG